MEKVNMPSVILCVLVIVFFASFVKCNMALAETYDFVVNYDYTEEDSESKKSSLMETTPETIPETIPETNAETGPETEIQKTSVPLAKYNPRTYFTKWEIETIATIKYMEAPEYMPMHEQRAWVWCFLNILDDPRCPNTVHDIVYYPGMYYGYIPDYPLTDKNLQVVLDVIGDYLKEKDGIQIERELPKEYICYIGDLKEHNYYRTSPDNGEVMIGDEFFK